MYGGRQEDVTSISTISSVDLFLWMQAHKDWDFVDTFTEEEKGRYTIGVFLLLLQTSALLCLHLLHTVALPQHLVHCPLS